MFRGSLDNQSPRLFEARLEIDEESAFTGRTLADAIAATDGDMKVVRIRRGETYLMPLPDVTLKAGDRLRVNDAPSKLKAYESALAARLFSGEFRVDEDHPLSADNQMLAEIAVVQGSSLDRTNLKFTRFIDRYQLAVLALHRAGKDIWHASEEIQEVILQPADILLVQGSREQIGNLKRTTEFLVLDASVDLPKTNKSGIALAILVAAITLAATAVMPIAVSAVAGAVLLLVTRCLNLGAAIRAISPSVYFVVVASLAVGIASQLGLPAEPFVLAVLFGANMSYATPMAYNTNLLVMSAGNYTFAEFLKVGIPLTLLMWLTLTGVLSAIYF